MEYFTVVFTIPSVLQHCQLDDRRASSLLKSFTSAILNDSSSSSQYRSTTGGRTFQVAGPQLWNTLPLEVTLAPSLEIFCRQLKTYLIVQSFPDIYLH